MLSASRSPKFRPLSARFEPVQGAVADGESVQRWLAELDDAALESLFGDLVRQEIAAILRMPASDIDPQQALQELGLDSLMAVELMTAIEARFGVDIPVMALSEARSVQRLAKRIVMELRRGAAAEVPADALGEQVRLVAAKHAPELGAEHVEKLAADLKSSAK
jgi:acyl carrier protein